ncbi:hypothetical protein [Listeria marthii]|uniref:hypothetical protein n=1 Tax=Listeria marthii TaxID=529731 RepID=UPI001625B7BA|nr:hypothetical protein [Listeria marthii]MBC2038257.1 SoxR reducing system RseC family protein [Listeria marthii]
MKKYPLIVIVLLALVGIGLLMGGFKSFLVLIISVLVGTLIFTLLLRLFANRKKTDSNYQKAVKQSKNLHDPKKKTKKKRKSSFKVIDGGKK